MFWYEIKKTHRGKAGLVKKNHGSSAEDKKQRDELRSLTPRAEIGEKETVR